MAVEWLVDPPHVAHVPYFSIGGLRSFKLGACAGLNQGEARNTHVGVVWRRRFEEDFIGRGLDTPRIARWFLVPR